MLTVNDPYRDPKAHRAYEGPHVTRPTTEYVNEINFVSHAVEMNFCC